MSNGNSSSSNLSNKNSLLNNGSLSIPSMNDYLLPSSTPSIPSNASVPSNRSLMYPPPPPPPPSSSSSSSGNNPSLLLNGTMSTGMYPSNYGMTNNTNNHHNHQLNRPMNLPPNSLMMENYYSTTTTTANNHHNVNNNHSHSFIPSLTHSAVNMLSSSTNNNPSYYSNGNNSNHNQSTNAALTGYPSLLTATNYNGNSLPSLSQHIPTQSRSVHHPTSINPRANPVSSLHNGNNLLSGSIVGRNASVSTTAMGQPLTSLGGGPSSVSASSSSSASSSNSSTSSASSSTNMIRTITGQSNSSSGYGFEGDVELNELVAGIIED